MRASTVTFMVRIRQYIVDFLEDVDFITKISGGQSLDNKSGEVCYTLLIDWVRYEALLWRALKGVPGITCPASSTLDHCTVVEGTMH